MPRKSQEFDKLDFFIINKILDSEETNTRKIASEFDWDGSIKLESKKDKNHYLNNKTLVVGYRLKKMKRWGFVKENDGKSPKFIIDNSVVKRALLIKKEGKLTIFEI
jgi:hypothetical protein